jgi:dihydroxyacetone kinase DhaKLM complex PTS-EIIA-like component DhaM
VLSVRSALTDAEGIEATMADAPLVEGAVAAAVAASGGADLAGVVTAAEEARVVGKL